VVLSLLEAETLRAAIHFANNQPSPPPLFAAQGCSMALRVLPNGHVADSTANFSAGRTYQNLMAVQTFRFIDCETDYTSRAISMLQRCLAGNTTEERTTFFHEVRSCRRRSQQTAVQDTAVGRVLCKEEELDVLHQRAVATRIKTLLAGHSLGVADAFAMFDQNRDGCLSAEELYEGLNFLGLHMTPAELRDLILLFDSDGNGSVSLEEFKVCV
jgi:hypothetical protein